MAKKKLHISFVLDETGSMMSVFDQTVSGFKEYIETLQRESPDDLFTLTKFNSEKTDIAYIDVPIIDVKPLNSETYVPRATTPLYDAIGRAIRAMEDKVKAKDRVLFVIMTDGYENASVEYTQKAIYDLIKQKEQGNWTFAYLGANQDAWVVGEQFGMQRGNTFSYNQQDTKGVLRGVASASASYSASSSLSTDNFFDEDTMNDAISKASGK